MGPELGLFPMASSSWKGKGVMGTNIDAIVWDEGIDEEDARGQLMLVGKIWAQKSINVKAAVDTMIKIWNPIKPIIGNIIDAKEKTFVFHFGAARDKEKVLENQPWHFDKFVWCFNEANHAGKITNTPLFHVPFWARVYDLPISGRKSEANAMRMRAMLGSYIGMEVGPNPEMDRAIRIRILHDVRNPLKAVIPIRLNSGKVESFEVKI
ncbi:uncharacterized protein LOC141617070 [Silene latifolia]|uniref:uncharacterized protein LOC141617070 n=1 Tax=Silene latifolia TaxID=37657 RepID=UPI003D7842C8